MQGLTGILLAKEAKLVVALILQRRGDPVQALGTEAQSVGAALVVPAVPLVSNRCQQVEEKMGRAAVELVDAVRKDEGCLTAGLGPRQQMVVRSYEADPGSLHALILPKLLVQKGRRKGCNRALR